MIIRLVLAVLASSLGMAAHADNWVFTTPLNAQSATCTYDSAVKALARRLYEEPAIQDALDKHWLVVEVIHEETCPMPTAHTKEPVKKSAAQERHEKILRRNDNEYLNERFFGLPELQSLVTAVPDQKTRVRIVGALYQFWKGELLEKQPKPNLHDKPAR